MYRSLFLKELPFFVLITFLSTKIITAFYIFIHNIIVIEQWSYSLVFRNQYVVKNIGNLISPIILAPFFETLIFCALISRLCKKVKITSYYFIFISSTLFATYHLLGEGKGWYTLSYTFFGGLIFAYFYNKQNEKHNENIAYITTVLVHSISNGIIACI